MFLFEMPAIKPRPDGSGRLLVVFSADELPVASEIGAAIQDYIELHSVPDRIYLVGLYFNREQLRTIRHSAELSDRLPPFLREPDHAVEHASIYNDGNAYIEEEVEWKAADKTVVERIRRAGLFAIFNSRQGLLGSTKTFHYIKPSGDHCGSFLRVAQVLAEGAEIDFIAC